LRVSQFRGQGVETLRGNPKRKTQSGKLKAESGNGERVETLSVEAVEKFRESGKRKTES
jgi:hypothetical protein